MTELEENPKELRIVIKLRKDAHMSPKKAAAQAVHAALKLYMGEDHPWPVIVLDGTKRQIEECEVVIIDEGRTEVKPNTVTAGASWDEREISPEKLQKIKDEDGLDRSITH